MRYTSPARRVPEQVSCGVAGLHNPGLRAKLPTLTESQRFLMGSLVKKRRKKMSKHKYRKRLKANRHKRKK